MDSRINMSKEKIMQWNTSGQNVSNKGQAVRPPDRIPGAHCVVEEKCLPPNNCNPEDPCKTHNRPKVKYLDIIQSALLYGNHSTAVITSQTRQTKAERCKKNNNYFGRKVYFAVAAQLAVYFVDIYCSVKVFLCQQTQNFQIVHRANLASFQPDEMLTNNTSTDACTTCDSGFNSSVVDFFSCLVGDKRATNLTQTHILRNPIITQTLMRNVT